MKTRTIFPIAAVFAMLIAGRSWAETYIPVISKGFQHQFWQAVKLGVGLPCAGAWATPENQVRVAQRAEALGYDSL